MCDVPARHVHFAHAHAGASAKTPSLAVRFMRGFVVGMGLALGIGLGIQLTSPFTSQHYVTVEHIQPPKESDSDTSDSSEEDGGPDKK